MVTFNYNSATCEQRIAVEEEDVDMETIVMNLVTTAINDVNANRQVVLTTYYDMEGRQLSQPTDGVFVKSIRYTDGTVVNTKVVK